MIQDGGTGFSNNQTESNPGNATTAFFRLSMEQLNLENMKCYCYSSVRLDV